MTTPTSIAREAEPCPLCGVSLVERGDYTHDDAWNWFQHPEGSDCLLAEIRVRKPFFGVHSDITKWNKRTPDARAYQEAEERIAKQREEIEGYAEWAVVVLNPRDWQTLRKVMVDLGLVKPKGKLALTTRGNRILKYKQEKARRHGR